jgi:hypothetical protein
VPTKYTFSSFILDSHLWHWLSKRRPGRSTDTRRESALAGSTSKPSSGSCFGCSFADQPKVQRRWIFQPEVVPSEAAPLQPQEAVWGAERG